MEESSGSCTFQSSYELIRRRLSIICGVDYETLERMEPGLVDFVKGDKTKLRSVIHALLPWSEVDTESTSSLSEKVASDSQISDGIRWIQWLMFEEDPELVLLDLKKQKGHARGVCGAVWGSNDIAYRCRTCEHDPTCAICVPCFKGGNHTGHDYSMIHTGGGCCDCGDVTAWKAEGFCSKHKGPDQVQPLADNYAKSVGPVLDALLDEWRDCLLAAEKIAEDNIKKQGTRKAQDNIADKMTAAIVGMLLRFCECSESLMNFIARSVYSSYGLLDVLLRTEQFLGKEIVTQLHELLFKLLGEPNFKFEFAKAFIRHYPSLFAETLREEADGNNASTGLSDHPVLSNFSVQIFTVPTLTPRLVVEENLLDMLLGNLKKLFVSCTGEDGRLLASKGFIANQSYIKLVEDIKYVMSHIDVEKYVAAERPKLSNEWLQLLTFLQGMDPQKRATSIHVEEESDQWFSSFLLEYQMSHIHPLFVKGAASVVDVNWLRKKPKRGNSDSDDDKGTVRHAKIGRLSEEFSVSEMMGKDDVSEYNIRDSCIEYIRMNKSLFPVPIALSWLMYESIKVLRKWLENDLRMSKLKYLQSPDHFPNQKEVLQWRGRGARSGPSGNTNMLLTGGAGRSAVIDRGGSFIRGIFQRTRRTISISDSDDEEDRLERTISRTFDNIDCSIIEMETDTISDKEPAGELFSKSENQSILKSDTWPMIKYDVSTQDVSFHIPLHRILSLSLHKAMALYNSKHDVLQVKYDNMSSSSATSDDDFFSILFRETHPNGFSACVMEHPLRIQVLCAQVRAGMWRRNGHITFSLCEYYHSVRWYEQSLELDLFLIQCCATMAPPDTFVQRIVERFNLFNYLSLGPERSDEYEPALVQAMLALLIRIVAERALCGLSVEDALKREIIRKLSVGDATHSQLIKSLPPSLADNKEFQRILDIVASYVHPSGMQQGKYSLRNEYWKELDLYHPRWNSRELQLAEERYSRFCKSSAMVMQLPSWTKPFDPLTPISRIATSKKVLEIIRAVVFYAVFSDNPSDTRAPDGVLFAALHLLALGVDICSSMKFGTHGKQVASGNAAASSNLPEPSPLLSYATETAYAENICRSEMIDNKNLLSLLVLLMKKHDKNIDQVASNEHNKYSVSYLIRKLLEKFAGLDSSCRREIQKLAPEVLQHLTMHKAECSNSRSKEISEISTSLSDAERKKALARERQAAIMAKMKAAQASFAASVKTTTAAEKALEKSKVPMSVEAEESPEGTISTVCSLCHELESNSSIAYLSFVQRSRILSISESGTPSWDTSNDRDSRNGYYERKGLKNINLSEPNEMSREKEAECVGDGAKSKGKSMSSSATNSIIGLAKGSKRSLIADSLLSILEEYVASVKTVVPERRQASDYPSDLSSARSSSLESNIPTFDGFGPIDCDGIHISSCGHAVHQECLSRYLSSLRQRYNSRIIFEGVHIVDPDQGEFLCPVCRRLANSVLPVISDNLAANILGNGLHVSYPEHLMSSPTENHPKIEEALNILCNAEENVGNGQLKESENWQLLDSTRAGIESLFSKLCPMYFPGKGNSYISSARINQSLVLWDVLRYSLQSTELSARTTNKAILAFDISCNSSKHSVLQLVYMISQATRCQDKLTLLLRARGLQLIVGSVSQGVSKDVLSNYSFSGDPSNYFDFMEADKDHLDILFWRRMADPILAHDPFSSLIWLLFCTSLSTAAAIEAFRAFVHLFYLVCLVQAIANAGTVTSMMLDISSGFHAFATEIQELLSGAILNSASLHNSDAYSSSSYSTLLRRLTLPYLRRCALLFKVLISLTDSNLSGLLESSVILETDSKQHKVSSELRELKQLENLFHIPSLESLIENRRMQEIVRRWCQHFLSVRGSRTFNNVFWCNYCRPFELLRLPDLYQDLLQFYIKKRCPTPTCKKPFEQPALCLLCGKLCCALGRRPCCRSNTCLSHANTCGAGFGVFLLVKRTSVLLQRATRQAPWPSPYLDAFGEEDLDLQRGKALYLSKERYEALTNMVVSHGLDHNSQVLLQTTRDTILLI